jgi:hypothetical protein
MDKAAAVWTQHGLHFELEISQMIRAYIRQRVCNRVGKSIYELIRICLALSTIISGLPHLGEPRRPRLEKYLAA